MSWINSLDREEVDALLPDLLHQPDAAGMRILALHWLLQLRERREQWRAAVQATVYGDGTRPLSPDGAAWHHEVAATTPTTDLADLLHKARVSLRRLRAVLREHGASLDDVVGRKAQRALRKLQRATNGARDRDVQLAWLDAELESLDDGARDEATKLRQRLADAPQLSHDAIDAAFAKHFDPMAARLARRLSWYARRERVGDGPLPQPAYAGTMADRLEAGATRILRDIERIAHLAEHGSTRAESRERMSRELHDIRLRLKRHRALLAPVAARHPTLAGLHDLETRGQDLLGAMRDAELLAEVAHQEGHRALERVLVATSDANAGAFVAQWVERSDDVQRCFDRAIDALRDIAYDVRPRRRTAAEGHGLPMEIERKYLLRDVPAEAIAMPPIHIEQGWIPGASLRERLRRSTYPDGRVRCTRTVKLGPITARIEVEEDTGSAVFNAMWPLTTAARIRKRRHVVRDGAHAWEIDVFTDRDLVLAEVELVDEQAEPTLPAWLAACVVREVTGDPAFLNSNMARPDSVE